MRSYLFNLIQAIQACIDIGVHIISDSEWQTRPTKAEIFEILTSKWVLAKSLGGRMFGFINRIVHQYEKTDMKIVHTVRKKNSADIVGFCRAVVLKLSL